MHCWPACRYIKLRFPRQDAPAAVCHGFAGYFDAQLYGDVTLSIHPPTHTSDMFSWFPIFFPLQTPVHMAAGEVRSLRAEPLCRQSFQVDVQLLYNCCMQQVAPLPPQSCTCGITAQAGFSTLLCTGDVLHTEVCI